jgi:hypothetical protein
MFCSQTLHLLSINSEDLRSVMNKVFHFGLAATAFGRDILPYPLIWFTD